MQEIPILLSLQKINSQRIVKRNNCTINAVACVFTDCPLEAVLHVQSEESANLFRGEKSNAMRTCERAHSDWDEQSPVGASQSTLFLAIVFFRAQFERKDA